MSSLGISGSFVIGGMLLLSVMGLFFIYSNFTSAKNINAIVQTSSVELKRIVDYDFNKIGYRTANKKVTSISSKSISFWADLDNNGTPDSIQYVFNTTLTRVVNPGAKSFQYRGITDFAIAGYDSIGQQTTTPNLVKSVSVKMKFNSKELLSDTTYTAISYLEARYNVVN